MRFLLRLIGFLIALAIAIAILIVLVFFLVLPGLDWGASGTPGTIERRASGYVLSHWIQDHAQNQNNPLQPTPKDLAEGKREFNEHCAPCHGFDGSAHNLLRANFYPPVARLNSGLKRASDGEVYFIVANGIRYTAMPGFAPAHSSDELWHIILWIRHFPDLTPQEKAEIAEEMKGGNRDSGD